MSNAVISGIVEDLTALVDAGFNGYQFGSSQDGWEAYTNALNLLGVLVAANPIGVGINGAAATNNTVAAVSKWMNGTLLPSDIAQISASVLSVAAGVAVVTQAPVALPVLLLAGAVTMITGPYKDQFNEGARAISDWIASAPQNESSLGGDLYVRQYSSESGEFLTVELVDRMGVRYGEVARISGSALSEIVLPTVYVTVEGSLDSPDVISWPEVPTIDLNDYTKMSEISVPLDGQQFDSAFNQVHGAESFVGNTVDFVSSVLDAAGYGGVSMEGFLVNGSVLDVYARAWEFFATQDWGVLMDPWQISPDATLNQYFMSLTGSWMSDYFTPDMTYMYGVLRGDVGDSSRSLGMCLMDQYVDVVDGEYAVNGSPIAIDLNGDGVKTISLQHSAVFFDIDGDGKEDRTAWLDGGDAFLVRDINENGFIDGVGEMFGGLNRGEGFAQLSMLDENHDGQIDQSDSMFASLRLWQDVNGDGETDSGELLTLLDEGVLGLSTAYVSQNIYQERNLMGELSYARLEAGHQSELVDVYFRYVPGVVANVYGHADAQANALLGTAATFSLTPALSTSVATQTLHEANQSGALV